MADISTVYESVVTSEDVTLQLQDISIAVSDSTVLSESSSVSSDINISVYFQAWAWDDPGAGETQQIFVIATGFIGMDPRLDHTPRVPITTGEMRFRETISISGKVPTVIGEAYFGGRIEGKSPIVTAEVTVSDKYADYISIEGKAPTVSCEALFGFGITGNAPVVTCFASLYDKSIRIEGKAPLTTGEITIPNYFIAIEGYAPVHTAEITIIVNGTISISGKVPVAYGSMTISENGSISIDGMAPVVTSVFQGIMVNDNYISISGNVPVVTMFHATGEGDISPIFISEKTKFDDLILQYQRWPDEI
jgi:hypothetical protein